MTTESVLELEIGPVAHGGHCVARHQGRVVFVRHTLPGERVLARLTSDPADRLWRADAVEILRPSPDRVPSRWPAAGPGGVGGGELAHVSRAGQLRWKSDVVCDVFARLGKIHLGQDAPAAKAEAITGAIVGYRTRIELRTDAGGRAGMYRYRSHEVIALHDQAGQLAMPLATEPIAALGLFDRTWPAGAQLDAIAPVSSGQARVLIDGEVGDGGGRYVRERVQACGIERWFRLRAGGFWQVHAAAPAVLVQRVLTAAALEPGQRVWDLYSGAGLFAAFAAQLLGPAGTVQAVESDAGAIADAKRNLHDLPWARVLHSPVSAPLVRQLADQGRPDVVVLDPPRRGAGQAVMSALGATGVRRVVYVACDPAALARDVAQARTMGFELTDLAVLDLFPCTHHVECIAVLSLP